MLEAVTTVPDLEQPLLEEEETPVSTAATSAADLPQLHGAGAVNAAVARVPADFALSKPGQPGLGKGWWDASIQATLAAVLCLWALKLVQQGYVDGERSPA